MTTSKNREASESVVSKIRKLLALAESPNEHEAALAMQRANELLLKHNLDMSCIQDEEQDEGVVEETYEFGTSTMRWKISLANDVARHNLCRMIVMDRHRSVAFIGAPANVAATKHMVEWISMQMVVLCVEDGKLHRGDMDPMRWRASWCTGAAYRIAVRLAEQRKEQEQSVATTALVVQHDRKNEEFMNKAHPVLRNIGNSATSINRTAYFRGHEAGGKIRFSGGQQVGEGARRIGGSVR